MSKRMTMWILGFIACWLACGSAWVRAHEAAPDSPEKETNEGVADRLIQALHSSDMSVRGHAAQKLSNMGKAAEGKVKDALANETDPLIRLELQYLLKPVKAGTSVWVQNRPGALVSQPWIALKQHQGLLLYSSSGFPGRVVALDVATGKDRWSFEEPQLLFGFETFDSNAGTAKHILVQSTLCFTTTAYTKQPKLNNKTEFNPHLYALNLATGKCTWRRDLAGLGLGPSACGFGDRVAFVDADQKSLVCLDIDSGKVAWTHEYAGPVVLDTERCEQGDLIVRSARDLQVLDGRSGAAQISLGSPACWMAVQGTIGVYLLGPNTIVGVSLPNRVELWRYEVKGFEQLMAGLIHPPYIKNGYLVFTTSEVRMGDGSRQGAFSLRALDLTNGKVVWQKQDGVMYTLLGTSGNRFLASWIERRSDRPVTLKNKALAPETGEFFSLWPRSEGDTRYAGAGKVHLDRVYGAQIPQEEALYQAQGLPGFDGSQPHLGLKHEFSCVDARTGNMCWKLGFVGATSLCVPLGGFMAIASEAGDLRLVRVVGH